MSQSAGKGMLNESVKSLGIAWMRCQDIWADDTARQFGEDFIAPVEPAARRVYGAMDRLQSACDEARRSCE